MKTETEESTPWMTVRDAAMRAKCGVKLIYGAVKAQRLKAVLLGGRRDIRTKADWVDAWLLEQATA